MSEYKTDSACRICGNRLGNRQHQAREMFFGTRDVFQYLECGACGTLQIQQVPELTQYYLETYYSFNPLHDDQTNQPVNFRESVPKGLGALLRRRVADYYCDRRRAAGNHLGRVVAEQMGRMAVGFPDYIKNTQVDLHLNRSSNILDVGSGSGVTLLSLREFGFTNLLGVDPFLASDFTYKNGVRVRKMNLSDLDQQFDLIIASHSLEHMPDLRVALMELNRLLTRDQYAIVRMPVLGYAWKKYGTDWVQLDAPRHLCLLSQERFVLLAEEAGFSVKEIAFDSTAFQFWGSEQYQRDIPLMDQRSYFVNPRNSIFSQKQIDDFAAEAHELNERSEGDQAVFYLSKRCDQR